VSYRGIYHLNTLTKLFESLMESRLSKFTKLNDTLTSSQQGSRITRQTHDAIYALIATIQERCQYGFPSYCCFIDFATAYPSVHRERLGLRINHEKTEVMMFYETPSQRTTKFPSTFHTTTRFPLSQPPQTLPLKEPPTFKYLGLTLDPYLTMEAATKHICRKINAAHQTVAAVAHSLRYDSSATARGIRSSPYVLFRI